MELRQGRYYSNGAYGRNWGVRLVMSVGPDAESGEEVVSFKGVAGSSRRENGAMPVDEFLRWVRYEVRLVENDWKRVNENLPPPNLPRQAGEEQISKTPTDIPSPLAGEG
jgi:hypothetical protein